MIFCKKIYLDRIMLAILMLKISLFAVPLAMANVPEERSDVLDIGSISNWRDFFEASKQIRSIPDNTGRTDWGNVRDHKVTLSIKLIQRGLVIVGEDFDPSDLPGSKILVEGYPELNLVKSADEIDDLELRSKFMKAAEADKIARQRFTNKVKILDYTRMHLFYLRRFVQRFYSEGDERDLILSSIKSFC